jgi:glucose-6-phosphate-specific signal transduction histidine kinase
MQELRAQNGADLDLAEGFENCLQEARLREKNIAYRYRIDPAVGELDSGTRALILRNLRCFVNFCKTLQNCAQISVELQVAPGNSGQILALILGQNGKFEHLDRADAGLQALGERMQAIGGEIQFALDDDGESFALNLYFDPLRVDFESLS